MPAEFLFGSLVLLSVAAGFVLFGVSVAARRFDKACPAVAARAQERAHDHDVALAKHAQPEAATVNSEATGVESEADPASIGAVVRGRTVMAAADIVQDMEVMAADHRVVGFVSCVENDGALRIVATRQGTPHQYLIPGAWVSAVDTSVLLSKAAEDVQANWQAVG